MFKKNKELEVKYMSPMKFKVLPRELWNLERINQLMKAYKCDESIECGINDDYDILLELKLLLEDELGFVNEKLGKSDVCRKEK